MRETAYHPAAMDWRMERVAKNEARHRELNELILASYESHTEEAYMDVVCECGREACDVFLRVTKAEYEDVRSDARHFLIHQEHFDLQAERVVSERDRFTVVAKREGKPAEIARQTDPRG